MKTLTLNFAQSQKIITWRNLNFLLFRMKLCVPWMPLVCRDQQGVPAWRDGTNVLRALKDSLQTASTEQPAITHFISHKKRTISTTHSETNFLDLKLHNILIAMRNH